MKIKCVCKKHNVELTGFPFLSRVESENTWVVDTSDMSCPSYQEADMYGCWNEWVVESD